jgi:cytochrome c553
LRNIGVDYTGDFHGEAFGGSGGNGFLKAPFQVDTAYAAMQCTQCHGAHGSKNIFNLRSTITVGAGTASETVMSTGGWSTGKSGDIGFVVGTEYTLEPAGGGVQEMWQWGAWCSFCHQMEAHGVAETKTCNSGHAHGKGKM